MDWFVYDNGLRQERVKFPQNLKLYHYFTHFSFTINNG